MIAVTKFISPHSKIQSIVSVFPINFSINHCRGCMFVHVREKKEGEREGSERERKGRERKLLQRLLPSRSSYRQINSVGRLRTSENFVGFFERIGTRAKVCKMTHEWQSLTSQESLPIFSRPYVYPAIHVLIFTGARRRVSIAFRTVERTSNDRKRVFRTAASKGGFEKDFPRFSTGC